MLDSGGIWRVAAPEAPPADRLVAGRRPEEARDLLGLVFNLCRAAQIAAFDIATGRKPDTEALAAEIRRDHLMQIFLAWPRALGLPPMFDRGWLADEAAALRALFGPAGRPPRTDFETAGFLGSDDGIAPLLQLVATLFRPGEAVTPGLPLVDAESAFAPGAVENSPAGRRAAHPAMDYVEAIHGRGPLWRAMGRVIDLAALLSGERPRPLPAPTGSAIVPATRGVYALRVEMENGRVARLHRTTPTDHILARGGVMAGVLTSLPAERGHLLPFLVALIDPCRPLDVGAAQDA
ncbi:hydrogenase expression/formation protein HupK [Roseibacterium sp. SDUM158016]|uniref:hydrogenase expression/formation protein HupK n=1 Tax=Roseicyclus sediminis TaxID=2980997 RepID=UPI0021CF6B61|nr:hydrogenase expression/formation protein HupK [Roseibacterium sp. SDUM158016]MCU4654191.1 hydrogenase expression/formation protein HupK [Roseibacterium sp. SDUM158016]